MNNCYQIQEQLGRTSFKAPRIEIQDVVNFFDYDDKTIKLVDYESHGKIIGEMST